MKNQDVSDEVKYMFRAYDIRGIYGKGMTEENMEKLGRAFSDLAEGDSVVVARDARLSGESLTKAFAEGVMSAGKNVIYVGILPLGLGMFHAWQKSMAFAFVTASHLPKQWNGLKFFHGSGIGFMEDELGRVRDNFFQNKPEKVTPGDRGRFMEIDSGEIIRAYSKHIFGMMKPDKKLRVAIDPGNGSAGVMVREFFGNGGFDVDVINEEPDGNFPGRPSNPSTDPLKDLQKVVKDADFGIALDGDGDRLVVMDETGRKLTPEQMSFVILPEILKSEKGPIIANVEVTRSIDMIAEQFKRQVFRIRVGHNYLVKSSWDKKACFGIERSGHFTAPWIFPFDDVIAIAYYFGCVLSRKHSPLSRLIDDVPVLPFGQINFDVPDERKFGIMEDVRGHLRKKHPNMNTMDGVRIDMENGWVLIRPSNTGPKIRLTIEANTATDFESIKKEYTKLLESAIKAGSL